MQNLNEVTHKCCQTIDNISRRLSDLSLSFGETGNKQMEETLSDFAIGLSSNSKDIRTAVGEAITEGCRQAEKSAGNVLAASLAGIELAAKQSDARKGIQELVTTNGLSYVAAAGAWDLADEKQRSDLLRQAEERS